jgi:hypothetical protein
VKKDGSGKYEKTNPTHGTLWGRKSGPNGGEGKRGKKGKIGRRAGESRVNIWSLLIITASDVKYSWFLGLSEVNFSLSADMKKRSQPQGVGVG